MAAINKISAALESLRLRETTSYTEAAKKFSVDRSILSRRHRGLQGTRAEYEERCRNLNTTQEDKLIRYIDGLCKQGLPPTRQIIRNFASEIAKKSIRKN